MSEGQAMDRIKHKIFIGASVTIMCAMIFDMGFASLMFTFVSTAAFA
jgi:hypothetical protein